MWIDEYPGLTPKEMADTINEDDHAVSVQVKCIGCRPAAYQPCDDLIRIKNDLLCVGESRFPAGLIEYIRYRTCRHGFRETVTLWTDLAYRRDALSERALESLEKYGLL